MSEQIWLDILAHNPLIAIWLSRRGSVKPIQNVWSASMQDAPRGGLHQNPSRTLLVDPLLSHAVDEKSIRKAIRCAAAMRGGYAGTAQNQRSPISLWQVWLPRRSRRPFPHVNLT